MRANTGQDAISIQRASVSESSRLRVRAGWIFSVALLALTFFSCTNNLGGKLSTSSVATIGGTGSGGTNSTGTFALTLQNVLRDSTNPTTTLDLIGSGTNAMGTLCTSTAGGLSTAGPSTCSCTYAYTSPSVGVQSVDVPTVYQESNLIECLSTTIPSDVTTVNVSVHVTTQNAYSNVVAFNLLNTGGVNPTAASSFSLVQRWQCRDILSIPYPGSPALGSTNSIYDPIQSQDPSLTYPINFYTTNLGGTLQAYINANIAGQWDCPSNPNDPNFGLNFNLYSVGPDSGGSFQISPTAGSAFDRQTFYVSKTQTGVYSIPLDSYTAPTLVNDGNAPLGYAASPVSTGATTESCPDTVAIPAGFHWAKLWLFRANLPDRHYLQSTAIATAGTIACDPGNDSGGKQIFPDCGTTFAAPGAPGEDENSITFATTNSIDNMFPTGELVNRVIAGEGNSSVEMCVQLSVTTTSLPPGSASPSCNTDAYCFLDGGNYGPGATLFNQPIYSSLGSGTDLWHPLNGSGTLSNTPPYSGTTTDPLNIHDATMVDAPKDMAPTSPDLDTGNSRYDFVFVVSPETVMAADMENSTTTSDYPYVPMRFPNASDCLSSNPNNPLSAGDCNPSKIIHYGLKLHDVNTNGDPPASDPSRAGIYPMCVIQPN